MSHERVFEFLRSEGLTSKERIERRIFDELSDRASISIANTLHDLVEPQAEEPSSAFDFIPTSEMTSQHGACCSAFPCRSRRLAETLRFAALYSDRVRVPNYFSSYPHADMAEHLSHDDSFTYRHNLANDIRLLWMMRPALRGGFMTFVTGQFLFCREHRRTFASRELGSRFKTVSRRINSKALSEARAVLRLRLDDGIPSWIVSVDNLETLYGGARLLDYGSHPPENLRLNTRIVRELQRNGEAALTRKQLLELGIPRERLEELGLELAFQSAMAKITDSKGLVSREIEMELLRGAAGADEVTQMSDLVAQNLLCELPFVTAPVDVIAKVRSAEGDSFFRFRTALHSALAAAVSESTTGRDPTKIARRIRREILEPELKRLDARTREVRRSALIRTAREASIGLGVLAIGIISGLVPEDLRSIAATIGGGAVAAKASPDRSHVGAAAATGRARLLLALRRSVHEREADVIGHTSPASRRSCFVFESQRAEAGVSGDAGWVHA